MSNDVVKYQSLVESLVAAIRSDDRDSRWFLARKA